MPLLDGRIEIMRIMIFFCPGKHAQFTARNLVDLEIVGLYLRKKNSSIRSVLVNVF